MKLHLKRTEETRGLLRKTKYYVVNAQVILTEDEAQAVKDKELGDKIALTYRDDLLNLDVNVSVNYLTKGLSMFTTHFPTSNDWEAEVKDVCQTLKSAIESALAVGAGGEEVIEF